MGQTAAKRVTAKDPAEKLAHRRMTVLELAELAAEPLAPGEQLAGVHAMALGHRVHGHARDQRLRHQPPLGLLRPAPARLPAKDLDPRHPPTSRTGLATRCPDQSLWRSSRVSSRPQGGLRRVVTLDLPVRAVLTDNGREFCGTERHPYELYLALNEIEHRTTRVGSPKTNGFVERFNGTVLLPARSASKAIRQRRGAAGRPRRLAPPLQQRTCDAWHMLVREKQIGPYRYVYLVESVRGNGRTKQRIIKNLGCQEEVAANGDLDRPPASRS